jgi:hypothetical protein
MTKRLPRASRPPQEPLESGVVVSLVKVALERIKELSAIWGPIRSYVAVITIVGLGFLHFAHNNIHLVAVAAFIVMALCLPLLYRKDDEDDKSCS